MITDNAPGLGWRGCKGGRRCLGGAGCRDAGVFAGGEAGGGAGSSWHGCRAGVGINHAPVRA